MSPERSGHEITPKENTVSITGDVMYAITQASENLPPHRAAVDRVDMLYAIMKGEGRGSKILRNLAYSKRQNLVRMMEERIHAVPQEEPEGFGIQIEDFSSNWSQALLDLVKNAATVSPTKIITTEHILLADVGSEVSILHQLLDEAQIMYPGSTEPRSRVNYMRSLSSNLPTEEEENTYQLSFAPPEPEVTVPQPYFSGDGTSQINYETDQGVAPKREIVDLVAETLTEEESPFIRKEPVAKLLRMIQGHELTVLVTDDRHDAYGLVQGLAHELAVDGKKIFDHQNMIVIDPVILAQNPTRAIIQAVQRAQNGILFLPNIQDYLAGGVNQNVASILRAAIEHASTKTITTMTEYQWHRVYKTSDFEHAGVMFVEQPDEKEVLEILNEQKAQLEANFSGKNLSVTLADKTLEAAVSLAARELRGDTSVLEGTLLLLQTAATNIKIQASSMNSLHDERIKSDTVIDPEDIVVALEKITGKAAEIDNPERYLAMEDELKKGIIGQDEAIEQISDAIRRAKAGLKNPKKPIGSFMFLGPTTVGKTQLARNLATFMNLELIKLDMSEYSEKHQVARMYGAPPGYQGYEEGGQLTEAVRRNPYRVILFDELEKAHPDVWNSLLQMTRDGNLTDGHGRSVKFNNAVIIATGNVGANHYNQLMHSAGLSKAERDELRKKVEESVMEEVRQTFKPEFLNRFDGIIQFNNLELEHIEQIVTLQFDEQNDLLHQQGITASLSDAARRFLAGQSFSPAEGAAPVERKLQQYIESPLARKLLTKEFVAGDHITIDLTEDNEIVFSHEKTASFSDN